MGCSPLHVTAKRSSPELAEALVRWHSGLLTRPSCLSPPTRCRFAVNATCEKPAFFAAHSSPGEDRISGCSFLALAAAIPRSLA